MGSINYIWKPEFWKIERVMKSALIEGDEIYKMVVGECDDEWHYDIVIFISKVNYENILANNYFIKSFPYSSVPILLFDSTGSVIPLVKGTLNNYDDLSTHQIDVIESIKMQTSNVLKKQLEK